MYETNLRCATATVPTPERELWELDWPADEPTAVEVIRLPAPPHPSRIRDIQHWLDLCA
jgi:hypothetical protein